MSHYDDIRSALALMHLNDRLHISHNGLKHFVCFTVDGFHILTSDPRITFNHNEYRNKSLKACVDYIMESRAISVGDVYTHHSGIDYTVIAIANAESTKAEYPPSVVYQGVNGLAWVKTWDSFLSTMTYSHSALNPK